jgi:hypothetical protein
VLESCCNQTLPESADDRRATSYTTSRDVTSACCRPGYLAEGWRGFDEAAPAYSEDQIRDYRTTYGAPPPL